ncbi:MAG: sigma-70 family RNA polymerase sigma factor [Saprospiraceae bacterium]|nr:sigma-70 family RNA polymerase sigma factor [Saprospiraceae bacterium]
MAGRSDRALMASLTNGDREALAELFERHYDHLLHYGIRINAHQSHAEECVQELFIYLFESAHRIGDVKQVRAYLFKSLRRRVLQKIYAEGKHEERRRHLLDRVDMTFDLQDIAAIPDSGERMRSILLKELNKLPWRQREAVYLRYYNRLSTKEIAEIMGVANQTVLNTLYQALKNLRKRDAIKQLAANAWPLLLFALIG